jgi:hypothetical protein
MNLEKWLLLEGKIYKLVDIFSDEQGALGLALALKENCYTTIHKLKDGKWGVYWRPHMGILCPYGVV